MKHFKRGLGLAAGFSVLLVALVYSIRTNPEWRTFNSQRFLASFREIDLTWILVAVVAIYATYFTRALRWQVLIRPVKARPSLGKIFSATVIGFGAIGVLGRPGEFVRPYLIARKENVPVSSQLAVWVLERSFDSLILLASVAFAVGQFQPGAAADGTLPAQWWNSLAQGVGLATVAILALLIVLRRYYDSIRSRSLEWLRLRLEGRLEHRLNVFEHRLVVFGGGLRSLREWRSVLICVLWSVVQWLLIAVSYWAVLRACDSGLTVPLGHAMIFLGVAMGGSLFQIPGVGGGLQIASLLALTELFQMQVERATSASILIWFITFLAIVPPAMVLLVHDGISWARLREIESEV